jgi:SP family general alpha glucoside:H+ symporter-like MFS transporter
MAEEKTLKSSLVSHMPIDDGTVRLNDEAFQRHSAVRTSIRQQQEDAKIATGVEKTMAVRQALRLYKWAVIYSMAMSLAVVMEG